MSKQSQHVLIALPHPLLHLVSLGLVSFIFTLFSLELSQFGTQLAPLWFPTSIMMVAFYRHAGRMWPGIALSCSLGNIAASILLFSTSSLNMTWTTINIVEAVVGAVLLRKLLPWYNPLQNLADWLRLALGSAIIPPLLGGVLVVLLTPGDDPLRAFLIWVLSESIGALALVPLGLLFKPHYLLRQLSYSASHDALTHLANRASFEKQLRILLQTVNSTHQRHALVFIDLDRFKAVNDSAGHAAGDALLRELASLMLSMLRSSDVLARLGGDEFGLLLPDCNVESARFIATRIISAVNDYHFIWEGRVHRVGASAGITLIDDNNHQAAEVMSQADIACYASKNGGRGRVTIYEPQQAAAHSERAAISLDEQWRMIKENQLMMIAHGIASPRLPEASNLWLISLKLWSCESEIIDEQTFRRSFSDPALSHALDQRVCHDFFQQAAKAVASKGLSIALPLSVAGLSSATLVNELLEQLENSPLPARLLHLIIPAEAIFDHAESVQKLRLAGCRIVFSQVGRDLQIFNSLKANMADYLLLDGELCANVQGNLMDEMLITIIQGHAQRLGMKTIAGPVVLPLVMDTLSGIGVDLIYGDVIANAQPLDLLVNRSYFAIN